MEMLNANVRAHARATTMARAAGERGVKFLELADKGLLGEDVSFHESQARATSAMRADSSGEAESVNVVPEDVEVTATIHARFMAD